ncbi:MAG: diaminopropionate ammonia-lyase [Candidatus Riflebacteria bacterium]|nr:diaminopropionate ammonia-lyase [Candidatus Riflebacteria bacterium]
MNNIHTDLKWVLNNCENPNYSEAEEYFSPDVARKARKFHRQIPGFKMSPLLSLPNLAQMFDVGGIWVKDEANRLQINSFKILGGSYAVYKYLKNKLGLDKEELTYQELTSQNAKEKLGKITFATATDGNHGRGIAWAAQKLGHDCVVYVHEKTARARIDAIKSYGAQVKIIPGNYDDAVNQISKDAQINNWAVISDTSWEGYTQIPLWIMQGYTTMMSEIQEQFAAQGLTKPTHVFVQAGVGALAASVIGFYHALFRENAPKCVVVEPENAACLYESILEANKNPVKISGKLDTIMAGLACGEPSPLAWKTLKNNACCFLTCPDYVAAKGMRIYATPLQGDPFIVSGESGAVTLGAMVSILRENGVEELRDFLKINRDSHLLFINTEGNTDPVHFREIIWEGANPVPKQFWTDYSD